MVGSASETLMRKTPGSCASETTIRQYAASVLAVRF
jgi:hypothetical protein